MLRKSKQCYWKWKKEVSDLDEKTGLQPEAFLFIFAFIFLYVAISYFGVPSELAAIVSGFVIGGTFAFFNWESIREAFILKAKPKKTESKVIEGQIVQQGEKLNESRGN